MRDRGYRQAKIELFYSPYSCCANLETTMYLEPQVYPTTHKWSEITQLWRHTCAQVVPHGNISSRRCKEDRLKNQLPYFNVTKRMTRQDTHQGYQALRLSPDAIMCSRLEPDAGSMFPGIAPEGALCPGYTLEKEEEIKKKMN